MRRALAALLLLSAACGSSPATPPALPSELVFVAGPAVRVYEIHDGSLAATLPAGAFDARLSGGGDVAEAYVVGEGGVQRVRPGRPFRIDRLADATGSAPYQSALVPAPALQSFVGQKTVLVTLAVDGRLAGYQAGTRIWTEPAGAGALRRLDDLALYRGASDWHPVAPETGALEPASACALCPDVVAFGTAFELHPVGQDVTVLAWPDGAWRRYDAAGRLTRSGHGAGGGRPGLAPDGSRLVWPRDYPGASAVAFSRDSSFVYALGGGHLRVFPAGSKTALRDYAIDGDDIALVAGG